MTRSKIIQAFLRLAIKNPQRTSFTLTEIAKESSLSRQGIYRNHFENSNEIILELYKKIDSTVNRVVSHMPYKEYSSPIIYLSDELLPALYIHQNILRILHRTSVSPSWTYKFEEKYKEIIYPYISNFYKKIGLSKDQCAILIIRYTIVAISIWLNDDIPYPPEAFRKTFLVLMKDSCNQFLKEEYKL